MDYLLETIQYFNNLFEIQIDSIEYLSIARELHLTLENGLVIWLAMEKDYRDQIDKLNILYKVAELDKEDLAYIDLRVREKVIYCPARSRCNN